MIDTDSTVVCRLSAGGKLTAFVWDRVYADRSAGQYESGWWLGTDETSDDPKDEFFLSDSGVLWGHSPDDTTWRMAYQHAVGYHVPTMRKSRDFDRMIEAMHPDFECGTELT